jgi:peptidoglycan/xylan/chitin deacetylase (PgdA/CDA1 family)
MRSTFAAYCLLASVIGMGSAAAADCPGNPGALGTSRTITVDPTEHQFLGAFQYRESLPLNDREVVLTFDDGPLPPYSSRILDILSSECVKATFFMVGRMAHAYPHLVKRAHADGHTLANHSQNHPFTFHKMTVEQARQEIEDGFTSIRTALGDPNGVSNFFRFPGLLRQDSVEQYLSAKGYMTWSVDFVADDWTRISANEIVRRALSRLETRGKGILLLHDIQPATALGLPLLLRELKARGYKVVQVVQASADRPKTATLPEMWALGRAGASSFWPRVKVTSLSLPEPVLEAPSIDNFGVAETVSARDLGTVAPGRDGRHVSDRTILLSPVALWTRGMRLVAVEPAEFLPVPDAANFHYSRVWKSRAAPHTQTAQKSSRKKIVGPTAHAKDITGSITRSATPPRPSRPVGHQIQLPKPTAGLLQLIGLN